MTGNAEAADAAVACVDSTYEDVFVFMSEVDTLEAVRPGEFQRSDETWVVEDGDETVGMAVVEHDSNEGSDREEPITWIHRIGVQDDRQGEGFGRALLEAIHDEYGTIELEIRDEKPANGFYDHLGMELVEERYAVFDDGEGTLNVWRFD